MHAVHEVLRHVPGEKLREMLHEDPHFTSPYPACSKLCAPAEIRALAVSSPHVRGYNTACYTVRSSVLSQRVRDIKMESK
jgi:hypothetical protein